MINSLSIEIYCTNIVYIYKVQLFPYFICYHSGVSRISFRGGGGSKFFWKSGVICMAKPRVCWGGSGACSPEKIYKNGAIWCVLESILLKILSKNNLKNSHFYIKITDNVLLRTIFRGIAAYTPQISCHLCDLVCFGVQSEFP